MLRFLKGLPPNAQPVFACLAALLLAPLPARAQRLPINPTNSQVGYVVLGLGLLPIHGQFQQFDGNALMQRTAPMACTVDVTIQVQSLHMASLLRQQQALSPTMLAADRFPTMHFLGHCERPGIVGTLTMHGVSRPVTFALHRTANGLVATGTLRRQDWGINGMPHLVGSTVYIKLTTPAPESFRVAAP
jgi:polyisoprenoid-binding protein YceI